MASELAETWSTTESTTNLQGWRLDLRLRGTLDSTSHPPDATPVAVVLPGLGLRFGPCTVQSIQLACRASKPGILKAMDLIGASAKNIVKSDLTFVIGTYFNHTAFQIFQYFYHMYISIWIKCNDLTSTSLEWWLGAGNSSKMASSQLCESPQSQFIQILYIKEQPFYRYHSIEYYIFI